VTFLECDTASRVNLLSHIIDGRRVDCKKARPKDVFGDWEGKSDNLVTTKIFVGGLPYDINKEEFVNIFIPYGEVVDCVIIPDTQTEMSRCFGFLQFKNPSSVDHVM
jgi:RNA recognition motif-containing protein